MSYGDLKYVVLDSTPHACQLVSDMLSELSAKKVHYFTSVDAAWKEILRGPVGCVIVEHALKEEDGFELVRRIRSHAYVKLREVPIILLTATREERAITQGRDLGVDEIIAKPFPTKVLKMRLDAITGNRRDFVLEEGGYTGPDRRRHRGDDFDGEDRRGSEAEDASPAGDEDEVFEVNH